MRNNSFIAIVINLRPKLWTEATKIGHIFRNQSIYQNVGLLNSMTFIAKIRFQKNAAEDFENQIFEIFVLIMI